MVQIGIGMTPGPNGPQVGPVMMFTPSAEPEAPSSHESHMETSEGIHVRVTFDTGNKVMADRYEDEILQKMGWKVAEAPPAESQESLGSDIVISWGLALIAAFAVMLLAMFVGQGAKSAGLIDRSTLDIVWDTLPALGVGSFIVIGMVFTTMSIYYHSSDKRDKVAK